jgi:DHA1 family multidrug resistance protein-like MFS transporter/DHA1 family quinolone resistance protein-like MFS transporter
VTFPLIRTLAWLRRARRTGGLFAAAFAASIANGVLLVSLQFRCHDLGGDAAEIGSLGGIIQVTYLFGCLMVGAYTGRLNLKLLAAAGAGGLTLTALAMSLAGELWTFLALAGGHGLVTCLLWPPIMGWLSVGADGPELARRLGRYNLSWSSGLVIGPSIGGFLYEHGWAFPVAVAGMAAALLLIASMPSPVRSGSDQADAEPADGVRPASATAERDSLFLILGRTANLFAYLGAGVLRYQLLPLAQKLHIDKATFGLINTAMSLTLAVCFAALGRTTWWHHRRGALTAAQLLMALSVGGLCLAGEAWQVAAVAVVGGACMSLTYYSSVYYSAAGGTRRASAMAVHEVVLSVGFIVGAVGGGRLSELFDLRITYAVAALVMTAGVAAQALIPARAAQAATANNPTIYEFVPPRPQPPVHNQPARKAG